MTIANRITLAAGEPAASLGGVTAVGATLGLNQYELKRAVDPANVLHQAITGKWKKAETEFFVIWTTDGWVTQQSQTFSGGDPVIVYDTAGNLVLVSLDGANPMLCRVNASGTAASFGASVSLGLRKDRPYITIDRTGGTYNGRIYVLASKGNSSNAGLDLFYSDDHGATWSRVSVDGGGGTPDTNGSTSFGLEVLPNGHVIAEFSCKDSPTATSYHHYCARSTNGGATWGSPVNIGALGAVSGVGKGGWPNCNISSDGSRLYFLGNPLSSSTDFVAQVYTSDDEGQTWSSPVTAFTPPSGWGALVNSIRASANVVVGMTFCINGQWYAESSFRVFAYWSFDRGATWSTPVEIATQTTSWNSTDQAREGGQDITNFSLVDDVAYLVWPEGSSSTPYTANIRDIAFTFPSGYSRLASGALTSDLRMEGDRLTITARDAGGQMRLGAQTHCAQGWDGIDSAALAHAAGFGVVRDEQYWDWIEDGTAGVYGFPFDAYMEAYRTRVRPLDCIVTFDFANPLYDSGFTPYTSAGRAAFKNYCLAVLAHYGEQIKTVEIWNEINGGTWTTGTFATDKPGYYKLLLQEVYPAIKAARPDVTVLGGATVYPAAPFWSELAANGALAYMDAASIHAYGDPVTVEHQIDEVRGLIGSLPLWVTEMGGLNVNTPSFYARMIMVLDAANIHTALWYPLRDYGSFVGWGLYQSDGTPYAVRDTAKFLQSLLAAGTTRFARVDLGDNHLHAYQRGDTWVIWGTGHALTVDADVLVRDTTGAAVPAPATLGETPYVFDGVRMGENLVIGTSPLVTSFAEDYYQPAWSYYSKDASTGALTALSWDSNGFAYWWRKPGTFLEISLEGMHPDSSDHALARFTAPQTFGTVTVAFSFEVGDSNSNGVTAAILKNGVAQWSQTVLPASGLVSSSVTLTLSAGDTVDIDLGPNGSSSFDATVVTFSITI